MHVALDGTPLLGRRTGIGRYTEHLLTALAARDDLTVSATAFTLRGAGSLAAAVPKGVRAHSIPAPARGLQAAWAHLEIPRVQLFSGRTDVFHATNFVLPPTGRAGGVVTIHDLAFLNTPDLVDATSRRLRDLVPRSLGRAAVVCTPTRAVAEQVIDAYGPAVPEVIVTPLGVEPGWLSAEPPGDDVRSAMGLPADYFLFVGTREPRKDLATLLAGYARFRAAHRGGHSGSDAGPPTLLLVGPAGWGPGQQPADGVQIRQYAPIDELRVITAGARALVMPSRDEGFGLPALEGLAAGVPVIVSNVPSLLEVTGGLAAVFEVGDVDALAGELERAAGVGEQTPLSPATEQVERARRRRYAAEWTWQRCAEATVAAYRLAERK